MNFNMKTSAFFVSIVLTVFFTQNIVAQSNNTVPVVKPSDIPHGYTYDFDKAQRVILSRVAQPDATNAIAKPILEAKGFPAHSASMEVTKEFIEKLNAWMEKNPNIIIEALKSRQDIVQPY